MDEEELRFAAGAIADADMAVAMSGAGVSTASGLPDFRSANGLWERYDMDDFRISRFRTDPEEFWHTHIQIAEELYGEDADPNPAHTSLAALERTGHIEAVITQNVDNLHQDAGSENVVELHGNGQRVVCPECHTEYDIDIILERIDNGDMPPRCNQCDSVLKPDVVLFGEQLPEHAFYRAHAISQNCDTFLVAGSSLTVEPAASLPETAADHGATLIIVTHDRTPLSNRAEYDFHADVTDVLPRLRDTVEEYEH
jgi:NAD-dependent deacetylase